MEDETRLSSVTPTSRIRHNGHKLKYNKVHLNIRINFFYHDVN